MLLFPMNNTRAFGTYSHKGEATKQSSPAIIIQQINFNGLSLSLSSILYLIFPSNKSQGYPGCSPQISSSRHLDDYYVYQEEKGEMDTMTLYKGAARLDLVERGSFAKRGLAAWEN